MAVISPKPEFGIRNGHSFSNGPVEPKQSGNSHSSSDHDRLAGNRSQEGLRVFLEIQAQLRRAVSMEDLHLIVANESRGITGARQVFVFSTGDKPKLSAVSGFATIDRSVPLLSEIEKTMIYLSKNGELIKRHDFSIPSTAAQKSTVLETYPFKHLIWSPFSWKGGAVFGGMLLARESNWEKKDDIILDQLAEVYSYTWQFLMGKGIVPAKKRYFSWRSRKFLFAAIAGILGLMTIPVSMKSLAPFEVIGRNPFVVSSYIDGVIEEVLVEPGQHVEEGQPLLHFSDTVLSNALEIASKEVEVSEARLKKANQMAFENQDGRHELGLAIADLAVKKAQLKLAMDQSEQSIIKSNSAGVAIFGDRQALIGKPVVIGEQIMSIADPENIKVKINLPVSDSILLDDGAKVKLFLDSDPLNPKDAVVEFINYQATPVANGSLAYAITARLEGENGKLPSMGVHGSAQLYGASVPLFFYLFRRPLTLTRQWLGF
ncbi:MAG: efflux RND transporter periplasmic adaptor subunit [Rhizobiaceae bacterium]